MKHIILVGLLAALPVCTFAQGGTNSPYSQYGLGVMSEQSQGFSRGMNGASIGVRMSNMVNTQNPASYSAIDSLTMIFDAGVSGQMTHFSENSTTVNQKSANFEYFVGNFRLLRNIGMSFGILPYSNVGYNYESKTSTGTSVTYKGEGGLHEVFIGIGWRLIPSLSIGANFGYFWGSIDRSIVSASTSTVYSMSRKFATSISNYKADFGAQWQQRLSRKDELTLGVTVGLGHKLGADATFEESMNTATPQTLENAYSLPMSYGVGLAFNHDKKLLLDVDFILNKWGSLEYPTVNNVGKYVMQEGLLADSYQLKAGVDYVPNNLTSRKYYDRIHYRLGAGYATPYYKINGNDGPKELSVSLGFGLPMLNNRSMVNISGQWVRASATDMITENTFRINIGLTFNERWFAKWKID